MGLRNGGRTSAVLDRMLTGATAILVVAGLYVFVAERLLPALQVEPERVLEGEVVSPELRFRSLEPSAAGAADPEWTVPGPDPTLLLVYSSTCPACYANLPAWTTALAAAPPGLDVLAVAVERETRAALSFARRHLARARPVESTDVAAFAAVLGIDVVPYTALVLADGRLAFARRGSLDSLTVDELSRALEALGVSPNPGKE